MKFLIDTNIFIPLEPTGLSDVEPASLLASQFAQLVAQTGNQIYLHPAALADVRRDHLEERRSLRELLSTKYLMLPDPPPISQELETTLGRVSPEQHDWVDHLLLAALRADAVDYLVTEDRDLRKKATRLGLGERTTTTSEAISILHNLFDTVPRPPPAVKETKAHALDDADPIFQSLRSDYPGFDAWLRKCKRSHRQTWVIQGDEGHLAGLVIVKREEPPEFGLTGKVLKVCTFKVSEQYNGFRFGELLLKALFQYAKTNHYESMYVTVFEKHSSLLSLLEDFGFRDIGVKTSLRENVLAKRLSCTREERASIDPLAVNERFGPFTVKLEGIAAFAVPIMPVYHQLLFPEAEQQLELMPGTHAFGNSIRKAYLCNAVTRQIRPGASLWFYRSGDMHSLASLGVTEGTLVSRNPEKIARYVGKRTVYSFRDIEMMCKRDVLAILFRLCRILEPPVRLGELKANSVLSSPPRSIVRIPEKGVTWLQSRLAP